jgi:hypothetical protein
VPVLPNPISSASKAFDSIKANGETKTEQNVPGKAKSDKGMAKHISESKAINNSENSYGVKVTKADLEGRSFSERERALGAKRREIARRGKVANNDFKKFGLTPKRNATRALGDHEERVVEAIASHANNKDGAVKAIHNAITSFFKYNKVNFDAIESKFDKSNKRSAREAMTNFLNSLTKPEDNTPARVEAIHNSMNDAKKTVVTRTAKPVEAVKPVKSVKPVEAVKPVVAKEQVKQKVEQKAEPDKVEAKTKPEAKKEPPALATLKVELKPAPKAEAKKEEKKEAKKEPVEPTEKKSTRKRLPSTAAEFKAEKDILKKDEPHKHVKEVEASLKKDSSDNSTLRKAHEIFSRYSKELKNSEDLSKATDVAKKHLSGIYNICKDLKYKAGTTSRNVVPTGISKMMEGKEAESKYKAAKNAKENITVTPQIKKSKLKFKAVVESDGLSDAAKGTNEVNKYVESNHFPVEINVKNGKIDIVPFGEEQSKMENIKDADPEDVMDSLNRKYHIIFDSDIKISEDGKKITSDDAYFSYTINSTYRRTIPESVIDGLSSKDKKELGIEKENSKNGKSDSVKSDNIDDSNSGKEVTNDGNEGQVGTGIRTGDVSKEKADEAGNRTNEKGHRKGGKGVVQNPGVGNRDGRRTGPSTVGRTDKGTAVQGNNGRLVEKKTKILVGKNQKGMERSGKSEKSIGVKEVFGDGNEGRIGTGIRTGGRLLRTAGEKGRETGGHVAGTMERNSGSGDKGNTEGNIRKGSKKTDRQSLEKEVQGSEPVINIREPSAETVQRLELGQKN